MMNRKQTVGIFGERRVARHYALRFYRIRKKNYKIGHCELDLIVENRKAVVFVEVKTRTQDPNDKSLLPPSFAVNYEKRQHLIRAARAYLGIHPTQKTVRFDIAEVFTEIKKNGKPRLRTLRIIKDAFHA